jgi:cyclic pyranopterin phosphate synthase
MVDITHKSSSLRIAIARATVQVSAEATMQAIAERRVPKGDVFEMAKTAGLFAVKRTSDMIPDCHPMPIEYTAVRYETEGLCIHIRVEVHTVYKTGVEVEAMHAASVVALTLYDMLKPIDKGVIIRDIALEEKRGGKSDAKKDMNPDLRAAVLVCSDSVSAGKKEDKAGKAIIAILEQYRVGVADYSIVPDETAAIQTYVQQQVKTGVQMIILTGGTGLSPRDCTPEAVSPLIERRLPGVEETIRNYGQQRMPYAMLSRSVAGMIGNTLLLALPGSTRGATESMQAVFPAVLHIFKVQGGSRHD